jgi:NTE family protein
LLAASALLLVSIATAREDTQITGNERLRVGLVLGGGGARGAAHIGVLRELERLRVPIDAIAGTSMGALIGGLYAAGYTADELEQLVDSIDWAAVLADAPRRQDLNFRRKEDDEQFPIRLELGVSDGELRMPKGLVQGHRLGLLLRELTLDVAHIDDFDELPIPFRAVASDLGSATPFVIGQGDLAAAMRASMSVPGIFSPAVIDGRLLADGGLVDNLPIDVIRGMDVDVVIAVDVEFPLYDPAELDSAVRITEQMLTILIRKETLRQIAMLGEDDVLIRPDIGTFESTNFGEAMTTLEPGAAAVVAEADRLRELALDAGAYAAWTARRTTVEAHEEPLGFVRIVHDGALEDGAVAARVKAEPGDAVNARLFAADADRLYGLDLFEKVDYRLVEQDGSRGVEYRTQTKSWGTNVLHFGLSLEDDLDGTTSFNATTRLTRVGLNEHGAEWRNDLQVGTAPAIFSEFYQPLSAGSRWFVAPRLELSRSNLKSFELDQQTARFRVAEARAALDLGRQIGYSGELRLGAYRGTGESRIKIGDPALRGSEFDSGGLHARLRSDTLDNAHFPTRGSRGDLRWTASREDLGADADFDALEVDLETHWTRGRSTLQAAVSYATMNEVTGAAQDLFSLGGFLRLSGVESGALNGPHAALARLVYRRRVGSTVGGIFDVPVYLGTSLEVGNVWQSRRDISLDSALVNGSLFVGLNTYIGPLFVAAGFAEGGEANLYLFIGAPPR